MINLNFWGEDERRALGTELVSDLTAKNFVTSNDFKWQRAKNKCLLFSHTEQYVDIRLLQFFRKGRTHRS